MEVDKINLTALILGDFIKTSSVDEEESVDENAIEKEISAQENINNLGKISFDSVDEVSNFLNSNISFTGKEKLNEMNETSTNSENKTYTKTKTKEDGKEVTITYNAQNKPISARSIDKDGVVRETTYEYNDDGSYTKTVINRKTEAKTTSTYDANGKLTKKHKLAQEQYHQNWFLETDIEYKYNDDGTYLKIINEQRHLKEDYNNGNSIGFYRKTKIEKYDTNGNQIINNDETQKICQRGEDYKQHIKDEGITFVVFCKGGCGGCYNMERHIKEGAGGDIESLNLIGANVVTTFDYTTDTVGDDMSKYLTQFDAWITPLEESKVLGKNPSTGETVYENLASYVPFVVAFKDGEPQYLVHAAGLDNNLAYNLLYGDPFDNADVRNQNVIKTNSVI